MRASEMREIVAADLARFESGAPGSPQRRFRAVYQMRRMNSLGRHPERPGESAEEVRQWATEFMRRFVDPAFVPIEIRRP